MDDEAAWALEERFWLEGSSVYDGLLDRECLMAFPGMGVMRAADVVDSLKNASRWSSVKMTEQKVGRPDHETLVLGYRAEGRREASPSYLAYCTSTYRADGNVWKLVQHQQTLAS